MKRGIIYAPKSNLIKKAKRQQHQKPNSWHCVTKSNMHLCFSSCADTWKIHNKSHQITSPVEEARAKSLPHDITTPAVKHLMEVSCKITSLRPCTSFYHEQFSFEERHSTYPMDVPTMSWKQQQHHLLRVNIKRRQTTILYV